MKPELRAVPSMTTQSQASLSIGDLARRTGVTAATLRAWETRYGFPVPTRRDSGHRRYGEQDVARILEVVRRRENGTRLDVAIDQSQEAVARATRVSGPQSVYAELRRSAPGLVPHRLGKKTLLALSWAIEDEFAARAESGHVFGAFQREAHFAAARPRWEQLALTAGCGYAFADFASTRSGLPHEVALDAGDPMSREWAVVIDAPGLAVALTAWELPGQQSKAEGQRRFEAMWTVEPTAVRHAARVMTAVAERAGAPTAHETEHALSREPVGERADPDAVMGLFNRMVAYMETPPHR